MKIWHTIAASVFMLWSVAALAGDNIPADNQATLDAAKVPAYPGATFCTGSPTTCMRLATSDSVEKVRQWYRDQLPNWNTYKEYGGWILYAGSKGAKVEDIFSSFQVSVAENPELPNWHGLSSDMTTEILIALLEPPH